MNTHNSTHKIAVDSTHESEMEVPVCILDIPEEIDEFTESAREIILRRDTNHLERSCRKDRYSKREDESRAMNRNKPRYRERSRQSYGYIAE